MQVFASLTAVTVTRPQVVSIGVFDGVHRGHQYLLDQTATLARECGAEVTVITFWPPPVAVLQPGAVVECLMLPAEKVAALAALGTIANVITLPFTPELAHLPPDAFMALLREKLPVRGIVEGDDFTFGYQRAGTIPWLQAYGAREDIAVLAVTRRNDAGAPISSTRIRQLVTTGNVTEAANLLGRPYQARGEVVHGDGRGRQLGFPTANLGLDLFKLIPANSIYAVRCWLTATQDVVWHGTASVGVRPQFNGIERRVEVFIHDIDMDLYGQTLNVEFVAHLRDERRFATVEALIDQMAADVAQARSVLTGQTGKGQP